MLTQLVSKESYRHQVSYDINRILLSKILFEIWLVLYRQFQSFFSRDSPAEIEAFSNGNHGKKTIETACTKQAISQKVFYLAKFY